MKRTCLQKNTNTNGIPMYIETCEFHQAENLSMDQFSDPKDIQQVRSFVRMKRITIINLVMLMALSFFAHDASANIDTKEIKKKKNEQTIVLEVNLHCHDCVRKIEGNIPYEKGVKDLKVSLEKLECEVTFRDDRTTPEKLIEAFKELGYQAKIKADDSPTEKAKLNNGHIH